ncbi:hypothetical protein ACEPAF_5518 [Sanghuangporus sanghuang]
MFVFTVALAFVLSVTHVRSQANSSWPHVYPGKPSGDFGPEWQNYFQVNDTLPNITFPLTRSFAGNVPVNRPGYDNNTLFFWAFEKQNGSLTNNGSTDPWIIWLQGGPGSSSLLGLILENGPLRLQNDLSFKYNNYSWNNLADTFWVDNPVGSGYSTADSTGYVLDDDQMGTDFVQFLSNLVKIFPSLATRLLIIAGESYAGRWIPYATKAIFSTPNSPVNLSRIAIGDGTIGNQAASQDLPVVSLIETYPQIIDYDTDILNHFREQTRLCDYDLNLTYPQTGGKFATLSSPVPADPASPLAGNQSLYSASVQAYQKRSIIELARRSIGEPESAIHSVEQKAKAMARKRHAKLRSNGTVDPWYACFLSFELYDYMMNYTEPWSQGSGGGFDVFDVTDGTFPKGPTSPGVIIPPDFFISNRTIAALHAPTSPDPQTFFDELATNATDRGVRIILYSGNDDGELPHRGTEVAIQNTTFGGTQGFTQKPSTPWYDDSGAFAGIVHQERNWTYVLFRNASHLVPQKAPEAAYVFIREFVLGNNQTGFVESNTSSPVGGANSTELQGDILRGSAVYGGSYTSMTTYTYASQTVSAWNTFVSNMSLTDDTGLVTNDATRVFYCRQSWIMTFCVIMAALQFVVV